MKVSGSRDRTTLVVVDRFQFAVKALFLGACLGVGLALAIAPSPIWQALLAVVGTVASAVVCFTWLIGLGRRLADDGQRVTVATTTPRPGATRDAGRAVAADGSGRRGR